LKEHPAGRDIRAKYFSGTNESAITKTYGLGMLNIQVPILSSGTSREVLEKGRLRVYKVEKGERNGKERRGRKECYSI
jgi:hypothetical protein